MLRTSTLPTTSTRKPLPMIARPPGLQKPSKTIHVLSVRQPFADLIIFGDKWCENRTWNSRYRGELYIHASSWERGMDKSDTPGNGEVGAIIGKVILADCLHVQTVRRFYREKFGNRKKANSVMTPEVEEFLQKYLAENSPPVIPEHLKAMQQFSESESWTPESFDHVCGLYCFILTNREPLAEPIKTGGKLNVWRHEIPA